MKNLLLPLLLFTTVLSLSQDFAQIDQHALSAPKSVQNDVEKLTRYLSTPASNDLEKVRAFYVWTANNIDYDVKLFFSSIVPTEKITANDVLKSRKSVCQGYSELFRNMCEIAGITCYIVPGYSKGYGWDPNREFVSSDHAWNIVKINNRWKLIDATWGSGYLNERSKFEKKFEERYFLTDPQQFILDHLPSNPMWQLLDCPLSIDEFKKDSTEIKQIVSSKPACYSYHDSIAKFEAMSPPMQKLYEAKAAFRFNPKVVEDVGFAYMNYAYDMTLTLMDKNSGLTTREQRDLQAEILEIYRSAKEYLEKSKSPSAKEALRICKNNIESSEHNLKVFDKMLSD